MQSDHNSEETEAAVREACAQADWRRAAELSIRLYGDEVFRFLASRMRSPSDASEVFSIFAEELWKAISSFEWRCSMRTFCYTLARNAANRYAVTPANRRDRNLALSEAGGLLQVAEDVRTRTLTYMRSEIKDRFRALREQLEPDDQALLSLRVDRNLAWRDLAIAMTDGGETLPEEELARVSAKLRKRFQVLKARIKELARNEGIL